MEVNERALMVSKDDDVMSNEVDKVFRAKSRFSAVSVVKIVNHKVNHKVNHRCVVNTSPCVHPYLLPNELWTLSVAPVPSATPTYSSTPLRIIEEMSKWKL